ncbi:MAG: 16S rRNA (uracil(1498)-N(3))-methyltransferase [Pirellulales bacterium]|nr:16S rRNA (uracil(1498)-N(3))-methyltransferase [Pirellulales bacterium]
MADRYFVEHTIDSDRVVLGPPEGHHLARVMRAKPGDAVTLFDGSGAEFDASVARVARDEVELTIHTRREIDRELPLRLTLAVALPKGDRQKWLVEKCVELGVSSIVPLWTERGVAQPADSALARLRRAAIEATKQCGRNRLLEIAEPRPWSEFAARDVPESLRLIAQPEATASVAAVWRDRLERTGAAPREVCVAVGPEGGFSDAEFAAAVEHGWQGVALGTRILRVETACLTLAATLGALADDAR